MYKQKISILIIINIKCMGSCSAKKHNLCSPISLQTRTTIASTIHSSQHPYSIFSPYIEARTPSEPKPYDPKYRGYQYNVIVEGVVFDVLAPSDYLDDEPES